VRPLIRSVRQLQRLAVFEAAGRLGSFTSAATELGMTQPAVSKQIKALEASMRTPLFVREPNRSRLTHDGALWHQAVTDAFSLLETQLSGLHGRRGQLRVAVQPSVAESWLVPRLEDLRRAVAPTEIYLSIFDRDHELAAINHDVSIRFATSPPGPCSEQLAVESVVPVAAPELAEELGLSKRSAPSDLLGAPLQHIDHTDRGWQDWAAWFAGNELAYTAPADTVVYPTYGSAIPLAISGKGVLLSWRTLMGDHLRRGLLIEVGPVVTIPTSGYFLQWPAALARTAGFRRLRDWLRAISTPDHQPQGGTPRALRP